MRTMRAKMQVGLVEKHDGSETVHMSPVCGKAPFGPQGESEDNTYARYTPSGSLQLSITNPNLLGKFVSGQRFYLDFTPADVEQATPSEPTAPTAPAAA